MNIYKLSAKELKTKKRDFYQTAYGKRVVCIYFVVPFISMLITVELAIQLVLSSFLLDFDCFRPLFLMGLIIPLVLSTTFTLIAYVLAYRAYYQELKEYLLSLKK